jgi:hypothetical protein
VPGAGAGSEVSAPSILKLVTIMFYHEPILNILLEMALTRDTYLWFISKLSSFMPSEQHFMFAEDHYGE